MDTGDIATWPIKVPAASATSETDSFPALRNAAAMYCSV
jgi:hypothetical protein